VGHWNGSRLLLVDEPSLSSAIGLATVSLSLSLSRARSLPLFLRYPLCIRSKLAGVFFRYLAGLCITIQLNSFLRRASMKWLPLSCRCSLLGPFVLSRRRGRSRRNCSAFQSRLRLFAAHLQIHHTVRAHFFRLSFFLFSFLLSFFPSPITSARIHRGRDSFP